MPQAKNHLTASTQAKNGSLYAVIQYKDENGKRKNKWKSLGLKEGASKAKINAAMREAVNDFEKELTDILTRSQNPDADMPVFEYMVKWLGSVQPSLQINTYRSYHNMIYGRIKRYFSPKAITIASLRPNQIDEFYRSIFDEGMVANTVIHYHAVMRRAFQQAYKKEILSANPFDRVERPKKNKFFGQNLSEEELACPGHHPFRPSVKNQRCNKPVIPSQRGASNVYFAVSRSAISIPPWINPLYNLIDEHLRDIELAKQLMGDEGITKIYEMYFSAYTRNEFDEALERRMSNIKEFTEIKQMEYNAITHHNDPAYESNKKHFKAEEDALPGYLQKYFSRIIRVTRLREVRVLLGFTRVEAPDPDADEQPNVVALSKGKQERWLPAAEVNGEGIFIEFNKDTLAAWLNSPAVKGLSQKYSDSYREFCESKGWTITVVRNAVYVLMHTFAHLMIKQMSMSSGYSSSAIRERIYFGDKMSGILLYTGSSDKEGSLGGLVELGNIDQMTNLMRDAFQEALVCTNDPECMSNLPAGKNSNGAACHSCCMISETACENGNRMLDRGLVVPIPEREECSYFKELVSELCQVEI